MMLRVGIDVGSTTIKFIILNESDEVIYKSYQKHFSKVREAALSELKNTESILSGNDIKLAITGSAGLGISKSGNIPFVQEVFATYEAVTKEKLNADTVIELGGEDAKIIFLKGRIEERMNGSCAGGTGAFIEQMATLLNVPLEDLDSLAISYKNIYPIASRCGVFAKSDIQPLINQGAKKEDIIASIFQAVVDQTIAGLAQGREISGRVVFLGGPLSFFKCLRDRFCKTLNLSDKDVVFPELARYYAALGSAYYSSNTATVFKYSDLLSVLENATETKGASTSINPLFSDENDYNKFLKRHSKNAVKESDISKYTGDAYLGIDSGSTTTKIILIDNNNNILYSHYTPSNGNPIECIRPKLLEIYDLCKGRINIVSSAVTGYGEEYIKAAFGIDSGIVETVAHYTAAKYFNPNVDFIIDIGGQDIKCFYIKDNAIDNLMLNEACSSGCGSFIETFAKALGYSVNDFAKISLYAKHPVDLGSRCTVFMNSSVKQAQKDGATTADIAAGLVISVVKNAIYKVIRARKASELGTNIVVQGGTFLNDGVLRSFEKELGTDVVRPSIAGLMGAFGAAIYAKNNIKNKTSLISKINLDEFYQTSKNIPCTGCTNKCNLSVNVFSNGERYISGNRCEKPNGKHNEKNKDLNMYEYKRNKLKEYAGGENIRGTIGIPLVLNMFENLPFWYGFFTKLGYKVELSGTSSRNMYLKGQHYIPSDTACYPAKLVHGHIETLIQNKVDYIFYPCMTYNFNEYSKDNHYNCPVVAYYSEVISANNQNMGNTKYIYPTIDLSNKKNFVKTIFSCLKSEFKIADITLKEVEVATNNAYRVYNDYRQDLFNKGKEILEHANSNNINSIILLGRPYHIDSEICHDIDKLLISLGFAVVSEDSIDYTNVDANVNVLDQWTYQSRLYNSARYVINKKNVDVVQLVSFGCGIDSITTDEVKDILLKNKKLYTQIKIDEINNLGAAKIRLKSLLAALKERKNI